MEGKRGEKEGREREEREDQTKQNEIMFFFFFFLPSLSAVLERSKVNGQLLGFYVITSMYWGKVPVDPSLHHPIRYNPKA